MHPSSRFFSRYFCLPPPHFDQGLAANHTDAVFPCEVFAQFQEDPAGSLDVGIEKLCNKKYVHNLLHRSKGLGYSETRPMLYAPYPLPFSFLVHKICKHIKTHKIREGGRNSTLPGRQEILSEKCIHTKT